MGNELINGKANGISLRDIASGIDVVAPEYRQMIERIEASLPAIQADSANFYKSHSQFMGVTLDVTAITPVRRVKHVLAELDRTRAALEEAYINRSKKQIELRRKQDDLANELLALDKFDREMIEVEILELQVQLKNITNSVQGAIRKMAFFTTQYNNILKSMGKDHITEEEYEKEEDRYHIMTALKQALCAARARGGSIDEGNQIYLFDMGINGAAAQKEVSAFIQMEQELMAQGIEPNHKMIMVWLEACANKFAGCSRQFAESKGYQLYDNESIVRTT